MSSSLLDALDGFIPTSEPPILQPQTPRNNEDLLQLPDSYNMEASGSSSKKRHRGSEMPKPSQQASLLNFEGFSSSAASEALFLTASSRKKTNVVVDTGFHLTYDQETPLRRIDQETPLRRIDHGGADQEQRMAEFVTRSIDNLSHGLTVRTAMAKLGLHNQKDLLPGLEVRLLSHQAIGVAWMLAQEKGHDKGGILADDMGLGKTVQMIATMAMNMPELDDECRTTLIVVPAALLQQWKEEIETKTNGVFTVHVHHGKDKLKKLSDLESLDVVLTTYQTLNMDFGTPGDIDPDEEAEWLARHGGILARAKFYRAVADEAQFIRNRATRSSITLAYVQAKYRWMLTGTPVTNTLADIYGLLRFGRFRPWNDWNDFNNHVAKVQVDDAPLAGSRAQAILQPLMLRRTKDSTLEGQPILTLPPKEIELVKLKFSPEERDLYDSFEKSTTIRINRFIRNGTLVKNHAEVLVLILRLRQLCCHPQLILSLTEGYEDPTLLVASAADKEVGRARKTMGAPWVAKIKESYMKRARAATLFDFSDEADTPEGTCPICKDVFVGDSGRVLACGHEICFECLLDLSNSPILHDGIFGYGSEKENLATEKEYETAVAKGYRPCPTCKKMMDLTPEKVFKTSAFEPTEEELTNYARSKRRVYKERDVKKRSPSPEKSFEDRGLDDSDDDMPDVSQMLLERPTKRQKKSNTIDDDDLLDLTMDDITAPPVSSKKKLEDSDSDVEIVESPSSQANSPTKSQKGKGASKASSRANNCSDGGRSKQKNKNGRDGPSEAVIATWRRGDDDMEPSTKMLALIKLLKEWDITGDKTICYSQWTSMLDLIEILFSRHGIRSLRFDGKMDRASRDSTLATFKKNGGPKVILISTKCGSVGLNLVSANRIINMDLSWNYAAESQAYDRCHRIGQDKTVHVKRLVVENTIEERMLRLQDVKVGLAEAALGEGTGVKLHKLSVKDIKYLFGMSKKDTQAPPNQENQ